MDTNDAPSATGVKVMMEEVQRCALDGCDEIITQPPGQGPRRKFCSPAHKAAERRQRRSAQRAALLAAGATTMATAAAPTAKENPAPEPVDFRPPPSPAPHPLVRRLDAPERRNSRPRRDRLALVLGAAAALIAAGGIAEIVASKPAAPSSASPQIRQAQQPLTPGQWVAEAQVLLASVNSQIDRLETAKQLWETMPPEQRQAAGPDVPGDLHSRLTSLQVQQTMLSTALGNWENLQRVQSTSEQVSRQLAALDEGIAKAPKKEPDGKLKADRDRMANQLANLQQVASGWRHNVDVAVRTPLPSRDVAADIDRLARRVEQAAGKDGKDTKDKRPGHPANKPDVRALPMPASPSHQQSRDVVTTSEPPNRDRAHAARRVQPATAHSAATRPVSLTKPAAAKPAAAPRTAPATPGSQQAVGGQSPVATQAAAATLTVPSSTPAGRRASSALTVAPAYVQRPAIQVPAIDQDSQPKTKSQKSSDSSSKSGDGKKKKNDDKKDNDKKNDSKKSDKKKDDDKKDKKKDKDDDD